MKRSETQITQDQIHSNVRLSEPQCPEASGLVS